MSTCNPCMDGNHRWCRYPDNRDCVCRCERGKGWLGRRIATARSRIREALGIHYDPLNP